jgi:hypothetical protein
MEFIPEEIDQLCKFFELLMKIDRRVKVEAKLRRELVTVLYLILDLRKE